MKVFRNKEVNLRKMWLKVLKVAAPRNKNRKVKRQNTATFFFISPVKLLTFPLHIHINLIFKI